MLIEYVGLRGTGGAIAGAIEERQGAHGGDTHKEELCIQSRYRVLRGGEEEKERVRLI